MSATPLASSRHANASSAPAPSGERLAALDAMRFLAAVAIVWLHTPESDLLKSSTSLGRFAVPFFTASAVFLAFRSIRPDKPFALPTYVISRFRRLYLPFLAWTAIYAALRIFTAVILQKKALPTFTLQELLWDGVVHHLWFLPFVLCATILTVLLARLLLQFPRMALPLAATCLLAGALALFTPPYDPHDVNYVLGLAYDTLPAALWAIALAILLRKAPPTLPARLAWPAALLALGLIIARGVLDYRLALQPPSADYAPLQAAGANLAGFLLLVACLAAPLSRLTQRLASLGALSFGIYLVHILFVEGFQDILDKVRLDVSPLRDVGVFVASVLLSTLLAALLRRWKPLAWLAP